MRVGGGQSVCDRSCFLAAQESGEFGEILSLLTTPQEPRSLSGGRMRVGERGLSPPSSTRSAEQRGSSPGRRKGPDGDPQPPEDLPGEPPAPLSLQRAQEGPTGAPTKGSGPQGPHRPPSSATDPILLPRTQSFSASEPRSSQRKGEDEAGPPFPGAALPQLQPSPRGQNCLAVPGNGPCPTLQTPCQQALGLILSARQSSTRRNSLVLVLL